MAVFYGNQWLIFLKNGEMLSMLSLRSENESKQIDLGWNYEDQRVTDD